ncbi:putative E3 ubiquitin ligase SUD1 isoform X2 [Canna indica]|uniref:RING-type E3 ubiquitin transferase n=1 Tax=Canna indica TaxID=4628 RepID=A0AAQ3QFQ2_9LILI|nr:putative E3 ubiquitin ligase SUD1 isoform X2 [Canna indica]
MWRRIGFDRCVEAKGPERDDEGPERNGARAVRRPPGPVNRIPVVDGNAEDAVGAQGIAGAGQIIRRNAENVAARLEMQAAHLEAHVEQMFDGLDDADGAEDEPFDELVGVQGPVFHLVENAITELEPREEEQKNRSSKKANEAKQAILNRVNF